MPKFCWFRQDQVQFPRQKLCRWWINRGEYSPIANMHEKMHMQTVSNLHWACEFEKLIMSCFFFSFFSSGLKTSSALNVNSKNAKRLQRNRSRNAVINTHCAAVVPSNQFAKKPKWKSCIRAGMRAKITMAAILSIRKVCHATNACAMRNSTIVRPFQTIQIVSQSIAVSKCIPWTISNKDACQSSKYIHIYIILNSLSCIHSNHNFLLILSFNDNYCCPLEFKCRKCNWDRFPIIIWLILQFFFIPFQICSTRRWFYFAGSWRISCQIEARTNMQIRWINVGL